MKASKFLNYFSRFFLSAAAILFCSSSKSRLSEKEIRKMEFKALSGDFYAAMELSDYYGIDLQDIETSMFWNCICFENDPIKGSWNFASVNLMQDGKSLRYQYLLFLGEQFYKELDSSSFIIQRYEEFHKQFPNFEFADDNLEIAADVTEDNYKYFYDKALSGSGKAALKIAKFYEPLTNKTDYENHERLLNFAFRYDPSAERFPFFWYKIGAQNGNKKCMIEYAGLLRNSNDRYDNIRADFWKKKSEGITPP